MASNENNEETFGEGFAIEAEGSLDDDLDRPSTDAKHTCKICSEKYCNPRVLACLHVFCQGCLDKLLMDESGDSKAADKNILVCPECQQETKVPGTGAASLPCDYVMNNILDLCAIQDMALVCTSCKTKKVAMSRCVECAQYLCAHCNTAHQLMRCFEDHHVVDFADIRKSALEPNEPIPIHKPIFCATHSNEKLKFFCATCEIPICNECIVSEHLAHQHSCKRLEEALPRLKEELEKLVNETKSKTALCHEVSASLENALSELEQQHDTARDLILETYQSYKAILEKCKDDRLQELKNLHTERELKIMDTCHSVEKTSEKIEDACKFTSQLLKHGNAEEILSLKKVVSAQLHNIINHTPKPAVNFNLKFESTMSAFENAVQATFGSFVGSEESIQPTTSTMSNQEETPPPPTPAPAPTSLVNGGAGHFSPSPTFSGGAPTTAFTAVPQRSSGGSCSSGIVAVASTTPLTVAPLTVAPLTVASLTAPLTAPLTVPPIPASASSMMNGYPDSLTSSPVSMQSSYDGEIAGYGVSANALHSPEASTVMATTVMQPKRELIRIREYNLHQLANLADKVELDPHTSPTSSPTPPILLTEMLSSGMSSQSHAFNNLQALVKLSSDQVDLGSDNISASINGSQALMTCGRSSPSIGLASPSLSINTSFPDDLLAESSMSGFGSPLSPQFPVSGGSYNHPRDPSGKLIAMQVRLKFGQMGAAKGQFNSPHGFCLGWDEDIVVADTNNHRIQVFEKNGLFKFQFGVAGKEEGLLYYPRKVAVIRESGKFVVCDRGNERSRLQTFTKNGHFIRKIAIRYIEILAGLAVTRNGNIVAVDSVSPTVFVIAESGEILTWFNCSDYMMEPSDITVWGNEFFVCDFKGHAVVVFGEDGTFKRRIGREPITSYPNGIDISDAGDVLVGDSHGNRFHIVVFNRQGEKLSEFECPYVKVSRCCGLKITSEGYVVTVAKNNHHVLVLNTLYIH